MHTRMWERRASFVRTTSPVACCALHAISRSRFAPQDLCRENLTLASLSPLILRPFSRRPPRERNFNPCERPPRRVRSLRIVLTRRSWRLPRKCHPLSTPNPPLGGRVYLCQLGVFFIFFLSRSSPRPEWKQYVNGGVWGGGGGSREKRGCWRWSSCRCPRRYGTYNRARVAGELMTRV